VYESAEPGLVVAAFPAVAAAVPAAVPAACPPPSDLDAAQRVLDTNLFGAWRLVQALLPLLQRSPAPRIVNVSSGAGSHGDPAFGLTARGGAAESYGISKAALNALTATLAAELARSACPCTAVRNRGCAERGGRGDRDILADGNPTPCSW
jgi:NAD(P)-dependent dehydrogenase (short-subunit alcohol dehydrogenase family)